MFKFLVKVVIVVLALQSGMGYLKKEEILVGDMKINYPVLKEKLMKLVPTEEISEKLKDIVTAKISEALASEKRTSNEVYTKKITRNYNRKTTRSTRVLVHVITHGETLNELSSLYGVPWQVIKKINNIANEKQLTVGQQLRIPSRIRNLT